MSTQNALFLLFLTFAVMGDTIFSQDCQNSGCPVLNECCERSGTCGTTNTYCGFWCFNGPCNITDRPYGSNYNLNTGPRGPIESIVTPALFKSIIKNVGNNCMAKGFYTRQAFIAAVKSFRDYKGMVAKREIAAILTHFSHDSIGFCYKEDIEKENYCWPSKKYPCEPGKQYYGRGPLQTIKWNEYYGAAGKFLGLPLLKDPDMVARNPEVAFKFAMWYWTKYVRPALHLGFGETSRRVDGRLCHKFVTNAMTNLVKQYRKLCKIFGVSPGEGLRCFEPKQP